MAGTDERYELGTEPAGRSLSDAFNEGLTVEGKPDWDATDIQSGSGLIGAASSNIAVGGENADRSELMNTADDLNKEKESPVTKYMKVLFRELERLWPTRGGPTSHAIAWNDEIEGLVLLMNIGDCVFPCILHQGDITDDPVATAENLIARSRFNLAQPGGEDHLITFKR
jgi:hypothetical protein